MAGDREPDAFQASRRPHADSYHSFASVLLAKARRKNMTLRYL
jgi:hypothetical protein